MSVTWSWRGFKDKPWVVLLNSAVLEKYTGTMPTGQENEPPKQKKNAYIYENKQGIGWLHRFVWQDQIIIHIFNTSGHNSSIKFYNIRLIYSKTYVDRSKDFYKLSKILKYMRFLRTLELTCYWIWLRKYPDFCSCLYIEAIKSSEVIHLKKDINIKSRIPSWYLLGIDNLGLLFSSSTLVQALLHISL